jgi:hypothetical protein
MSFDVAVRQFAAGLAVRLCLHIRAALRLHVEANLGAGGKRLLDARIEHRAGLGSGGLARVFAEIGVDVVAGIQPFAFDLERAVFERDTRLAVGLDGRLRGGVHVETAAAGRRSRSVGRATACTGEESQQAKPRDRNKRLRNVK